MAGGGEEAKAGNAAGYTHAMSTAATTDGEFLLHLLRKGIRSNKNQTAVTTNSNNYTNKPTASSSASHSAEVEAWQLADPAVAAYGPSHPFHTTQIQSISSSNNNNNNNNSNPHRWLNSFHHHRNRTEDSSSPCSLDPLLRPSLNPYDCWSHPSPFANYPEQFHKPYDKPLLPFPDRSFGGTPCGCGGASAPSCGNVHGPFAVPRVPEAPWMAGAAGVAREDRVWPLHPAGGAGIVQRPLSLFPGNEAVPPVNSGNYQNAFAGGGVWQLQKSESQFAGNGADFFEHLRGLSGMSENGFSMSGFVAPGGCDPCVGSLTGNGSQNAKGNRMCVGRNDAGPVGLVPSHSGAAVGSDIPEACGDRCFRFRPTALHSEHNMCITEGSPMNGIRQCDRKGIEMRSGDIILPKSELPLKLQGEADVVRVLSRPSSNQRVSEGRTVLEGVVCREDLKIRDACFPVRIVDDPIRRVAREGISSFEQGISEGTTWLGDGRRKTVVREETAFCTSNSVYVDDRRQAADRESAVEVEKDGSQNIVCRSGCGRSELMRRVGVRNGAVQQMVLNARQDRESTKELTDVDEDGEVTEMWSLKSQDRNIRKPQNDSKKYRGNQHEWHMKQLQAEDEMHCCDLDSFPTIAGHFSTLEANESDSCNLNDCLKKCSFRGIRQPDISSCSEPLAFWHENHCLPSGSKLHSASASTIEQSCKELHGGVLLERKHRIAIERRREGEHQMDSTRGRYDKIDKKDADGLLRELGGCLKLVDDSNSEVTNDNGNNLTGSRLCKDLGLDHHQVTLTANQHRRQRLMRPQRKEIQYRADLEMLTSKFLLLYQSLIPQKEEEAKRKQLISCLEKLINREWPGAQLHLFGSCANAFGVSNSDIDVCLSIDDEQSSKPELVLKLADILQSDDMQDVQALTHARVPIVKFTDPITDISCDICINNILAVVNTKLLHDYAQIDIRLQQLVLMVKHWAKCRQINETYRGTLSSYAYVLMCIHFLQQRKPAILPCLQEMETTYQVTIGKIECAYYDQVDKLNNYGAENKETLGQLLSAFFDYWAFRHDYTNSVISVRTGGLLSKHEKDWTRRIGNERHLICIEDPFETSHDLGRVVDKHSIRVLKEEFRRAAEIMQHDPDPCVTLFKPYTSS